MDEIWLQITDCPVYLVSSQGRVRHLKGLTPLKPWVGSSDYLTVGLYHPVTKQRLRRMIHTLVAEAFLGQRPEGYEINHRDYNRHNNAVENLEYITPDENLEHRDKRRGWRKLQTLI